MRLHCTQKLAVKLSDVSAAGCGEASPFNHWHAQLYVIDRRQCVLFCHDLSHFMVFLPGITQPQFAELEAHFRAVLFATLQRFGVTASRLKAVALAWGPACYDTVTNRSVLSSMNIARRDLDGWLERVPNVMELDPVAVSAELSQRPVTVHKQWSWPNQVMLAAVAAL